jgi:hypothetical protein
MRNVSYKIAKKIKTYISFSIFFFRKSCRLRNNLDNYGRERRVADDNIIRCKKERKDLLSG